MPRPGCFTPRKKKKGYTTTNLRLLQKHQVKLQKTNVDIWFNKICKTIYTGCFRRNSKYLGSGIMGYSE